MFSGSTFASRIKTFHRFAVHLEALRAQVTNSKEVENPDNRSVEEDIIGALSESLHHFDVVNYTEDPPVRPYWGKYCGILKEDYYGCLFAAT